MRVKRKQCVHGTSVVTQHGSVHANAKYHTRNKHLHSVDNKFPLPKEKT